MIYTVEEHGADGVKTQTYEGFKQYRGENANIIAAVAGPDGLSMWVIDEHKELAVGELKRYYRASYGVDVEVILFQNMRVSYE